MRAGLDTSYEVITLSGIGITLLLLHITVSRLSAVPVFQRIIRRLSPETVVERFSQRRRIRGLSPALIFQKL